ncbi:MAG: M28 family peptidase [Saprospiraceae bacterium]|nr:M28 family peptidase [Saprospiraceae bacterium]
MSAFRPILSVLALIGLAVQGFAQNQAPVLTDFTANINWNTSTLTLEYNVSDAENDPLEVLVSFSKDGGKTYQIDNLVGCVGDMNYPVTPGLQKKITCATDMLIGVAPNFRVRLVANDLQPLDIQGLVNQVDSNRLRADLQFVQGIRHRNTGLAKLTAVRDSMQHLLEAKALYTQDLTFAYAGGYTAHNIVGQAVGLTAADTVVIVDAHYDGVSNGPGADDNGSGVVGVWEIARILGGLPSKKTVRYIGFDLEEAGLLGSINYVVNHLPTTEKIKGVYNFEMIGFYSEKNNSQTLPAGFNQLFPAAYNAVAAQQFKGNFITNVGNVASKALTDQFVAAAAQYVPDLRVITVNVPGTGSIAQDLRRSDHAPFWDGGHQAVMLTDGANFRNPNYHQAGDTLGALNFTFMSNVVKATLAAIAESAELLHGDQAFANFDGLVSVKQPLDCNFMAYTVPSDRSHIYIRIDQCANDPLNYTLFDAKGSQVATGNLESLAGTLQSVAITPLQAGFYLLRLSNAAGAKTVKLHIE